MKNTILILSLIFSSYQSFSQFSDWNVFANGNHAFHVETDGNYMWIGSLAGLVRYDKTTGDQMNFNKTNSELPDDFVYDISSDHHGKIWMGTPLGLASYDGNNFEVFNMSNSEIGGNIINSVWANQAGEVWYVYSDYQGSGVGKLIDGVFTNYPSSSPGNPPSPSKITYDETSGDAWVISDYDEYKLDGTDWEVISDPLIGISTAIAFSPDGTLWLGSDYGEIAKYDGVTWTTDIPVSIGQPWIEDIAFDNSGDAWIAAGGAGLYLYSNGTWTIYNNSNSSLPSDQLTNIVIDDNDVKWLGSYVDLGLIKYDNTDFTAIDVGTCGIPGNTIFDIDFTSNHEAFLACYYNGLSHYENGNFTNDSFVVNASTYPLQEVAIDDSDHVWTNTYTHFSRFENGAFTNYFINDYISFATIYSCATDHSGNLWIGTSDGLLRFHSPTDYTVYTHSNSGLPKNNCAHVMVDHANNVWVSFGSTVGNGIAKFDGTNWTQYKTSNSDIPSNKILCAIEDRQYNIWLGTPDKGLAKFDGTNWSSYTTSNSNISSNDVFAIGADTTGGLWFGFIHDVPYYIGLEYFNGVDFTEYNSSNSALTSCAVIRNIVVDENTNRAWIGSDYGLTVSPSEMGIATAATLSVVQQTLSVYPNPASDVLNIQMGSIHPGYGKLIVTNMLGQTILTGKVSPGDQELHLDISGLSKGIYVLSISNAGTSKNISWVKE